MIKISECYILKYHLFLLLFFVQGKPETLSSVSSVENDKQLIILQTSWLQFENAVEVLRFFLQLQHTMHIYLLGVGLKLDIDTLLHPQHWVPFPV